MQLAEQQTIEVVALVATIVRALVDSEEVEVTASETGQVTSIRIAVPVTELGKVIGKQGRTARCIRMIINGCGRKQGRSYVVDIARGQPDTIAA